MRHKMPLVEKAQRRLTDGNLKEIKTMIFGRFYTQFNNLDRHRGKWLMTQFVDRETEVPDLDETVSMTS